MAEALSVMFRQLALTAPRSLAVDNSDGWCQCPNFVHWSDVWRRTRAIWWRAFQGKTNLWL